MRLDSTLLPRGKDSRVQYLSWSAMIWAIGLSPLLLFPRSASSEVRVLIPETTT